MFCHIVISGIVIDTIVSATPFLEKSNSADVQIVSFQRDGQIPLLLFMETCHWLPPRQQLLHHQLLAWMATWQRSRKLCWIILEEPGLFEIVSQIWEPNSISWVIIMFHVFLLKLDRMDYISIIQHFVCQLWMTRLMRHVSFNRWLVRYLYVPLGGRKCPGFPGFQHLLTEAQVSSGCSWPLLIVDIMVIHDHYL